MESKVFISYSQEDQGMARRIATAIKQAGIEVWIDLEKMEWGASFIAKMNEGLSMASYVILLLSPAANASRWVQREWMSTLADQGTVLLPVLIADTVIPPILQDLLFVDLRTDFDKGLQKIIDFFAAEHSPSVSIESDARTRASEETHPLQQAPRNIIRLVAQHCLREQNFIDFLFHVDISESQVAGNSLKEKITRLLADLHAAGISQEFVDWVLFEPDTLLRRCIDGQIKKYPAQ